MKNNFIQITLILFIFSYNNVFSEELNIQSTKVKIDNNTKISIFEGSVNANDVNDNKIITNYAEYNKIEKTLKTKGFTKLITAEGYELTGTDIFFDNKNKIISSSNKSKLIDKENNEIFLDMFNYSTKNSIFFSKGDIKIIDINNNNYYFTEVYIDEKKRKIIGTDIKAYLNDEGFKISEKNEPRFFANTMSLSKNISKFDKGIFTYCAKRENGKCPPWTIRSKKIEHNSSTKTIYYKNAMLEVYDFPIFYFPYLSHPDPTVKRRSGLLPPTLTDNSNVGIGLGVPYFWSIANDKDLTFTTKLYGQENPLFLSEYRQDFKDSFLIVDGGYTSGYKKSTVKKSEGTRTHLFLNYTKRFLKNENSNSNLEINLQQASNDTYFKVHDISTSLANKNLNILENTINYDYRNNDLYLDVNISAYDDLNIEDNSKYEYLLPYISLEKDLLTHEKYGFFDLGSKLRVRNYEGNKQTEQLVNDINWKSNKIIDDLGFESQLIGKAKVVNYNAKNTENYKVDENNSELSGVIGYLTKIRLYKDDLNKNYNHLLTPKTLIRYAPGHMRKLKSGSLNYSNLYDINKNNEIDVIEKGLSATVGFDYKKNNLDKNGSVLDEIFSFSAGQVINAEENKDMASSTSLDQKFSDVVGESKLKISKNLNLSYDFAIDQNYKETNYNNIGAEYSFLNKTKFNINYLEENNHIGNEKYLTSDLDLSVSDSGKLSFSTKRNLVTNSAEFYDLSYEYLNDCLRAGLAYRREFYTDRDIEPQNSLMFKITIVPFAQVNSPSFNR